MSEIEEIYLGIRNKAKLEARQFYGRAVRVALEERFPVLNYKSITILIDHLEAKYFDRI